MEGVGVRPPGRDQTAFVVLGIATAWGLPPSAAVHIRTLLEEVFEKRNLVETSNVSPELDETSYHLEEVVHAVDSGPLAGTTWVLSASKEAGESALEWRTGLSPDEFDSGEAPGFTALTCRESPARALRLGFLPNGSFWDTIGPLGEPSARAGLEG